MKTILFVPTYWYSSLELFTKIIEGLNDKIKKVLLETGDPHYKKRRDKKNTFEHYFDQMIFLTFPDTLKKTIKAIPKILRYQRQFKNVFEVHKPDLIITTGDRNNFYTLLQHYKGNDVPILLLQESLVSVKYYNDGQETNNSKLCPIKNKRASSNFNKDPHCNFLTKRMDYVFNVLKKSYYTIFRIKPFLSVDYNKGWGLHDPQNHLIVWGPTTEKLFNRYRKKISGLGNPLVDDLYILSLDHKKKNDLYAQIGIDSTNKTILISAPCLADIGMNSELFFWYDSIIKEFDKLNFLIKIHPRDNIDNFFCLLKFDNVKIVESEYTFKDLIQISDLSLSHYSATSIDAVVSGIPVILLPITALSKDDQDYWFSASIFIKPKSVNACIDFIKELLKDSRLKSEYEAMRTDFVHDMFSENIGHATEKIICRINELL